MPDAPAASRCAHRGRAQGERISNSLENKGLQRRPHEKQGVFRPCVSTNPCGITTSRCVHREAARVLSRNVARAWSPWCIRAASARSCSAVSSGERAACWTYNQTGSRSSCCPWGPSQRMVGGAVYRVSMILQGPARTWKISRSSVTTNEAAPQTDEPRRHRSEDWQEGLALPPSSAQVAAPLPPGRPHAHRPDADRPDDHGRARHQPT